MWVEKFVVMSPNCQTMACSPVGRRPLMSKARMITLVTRKVERTNLAEWQQTRNHARRPLGRELSTAHTRERKKMSMSIVSSLVRSCRQRMRRRKSFHGDDSEKGVIDKSGRLLGTKAGDVRPRTVAGEGGSGSICRGGSCDRRTPGRARSNCPMWPAIWPRALFVGKPPRTGTSSKI
jgi:hypothetical protein